MRDRNIDLLRFIGLSLIILAHVMPPLGLLNLRCFDVPLMVFISGLTCYKKDIKFSWGYLSHRFSRLVFPVWIFLTVYFTPIVLLKYIGIDLGLNFRHIWGSYLLLDGIGYVWIIRVFLLIALLTPALIGINRTIKNNNTFVGVFSLALVLYLLVSFYRMGLDVAFIRDWVYYAIGYGFVFLLGIRIKELKSRDKIILFAVLVLFFVVMGVVDNCYVGYDGSIFYHINDWKYPPSNVFLLYGLIMAILCYMIIYRKKREKLNAVVNFIGCNSIWIYLWHIPLVAITEKVGMIWWIGYVFVYLGAVCIYLIQLSLVKMIEKRKVYGILKYLKG